MSGKPKGSGKRLTVPVLQGPSRNRRPQPREQQPAPRVQQPPPKRRTTQVEPALPPLRQAVVEDPIPRTNFESRWAKKKDLLRQEREDRRISQKTITDCLQKEHVAFMQGSNMIHLPSVLAGGGLLCSDFLRSLSRATFTKDAGNRTGDVCYFRFIKDTRPEGRLSSKIIQENINNFASVGLSGGIFYVLRASEVSGLTYRTAASTDSKGKGTSTIEFVVESRRWAHNGNDTEIGFSYAVDFTRISEVYIGGNIQKSMELGDPIYNEATALLEQLEQRGISLPEKRAELEQIERNEQWTLSLLKFFLGMAGLASRGSVQTKRGKFDVFERTGDPDYVRGFRYNQERAAHPNPLEIHQEVSSTKHADASGLPPPAKHAVTSKPAPRAKVSAASGQTGSRKRSQHAAQAQIVKPSVGAGNKKAGVGGGRLRK